MEKQQSFSHGLLYSISPESFSELHLHDEDGLDGFDWAGNESQFAGGSFVQAILSFLKISVSKR